MQAIIFLAAENVRCTRVPDPEILAPDEVIVKVTHAGICGSDLHVYHAREKGLDAGTILGHEFTGEIVALGGDVESFGTGDRVVSPFTTCCGTCFYCQRGLTSRCERGQLFGWVENGEGLPGAQAEFVRVPMADTTLLPAPAELTAEGAVLLGDVLPTGYFAARNAGIARGDVCAVVGCGPVGLMAVLSARELGAAQVFAVDARPERLALAEQFGAVPLDFGRDTIVEAIRENTQGRGVDAAIEAVGTAGAARSAFELIRPGGTISAVGVHTEAALAFTPVEAYEKNITFRVGRCPARHLIPRLLPFAVKNAEKLRAIVSHRFSLQEGKRGYYIFANKLDGCTKVLLAP